MKTKIKFLLLISFTVLISCGTDEIKHLTPPETGTYKVAILYPNGANKTFDMDYYEKKHMPMMAGLLGDNLKFYEIDKGIAGRTDGDKVSFVTMGYFYINNVDEYNKVIARNIDTIRNDIPKYTNIQPIIQINEIKQWKSNHIK
ncbi:EthD family reductase [Sinomicrobium kalidii]|uniref:EthD family reductase n=1 Tax=Sinomicrobium kalidii TaxID=2900738 RepID=UPI001E53027B|nr:EthD family reductase [Sinomicrobium kalidii]UGU17860.1 EthD family reductase [Sinomicrobium kalidii]